MTILNNLSIKSYQFKNITNKIKTHLSPHVDESRVFRDIFIFFVQFLKILAFVCKYVLLNISIIHSTYTLNKKKKLVLVVILFCFKRSFFFVCVDHWVLVLEYLGQRVFKAAIRIPTQSDHTFIKKYKNYILLKGYLLLFTINE